MHGDCSDLFVTKKAKTKQLCLFLKGKLTGFLDSKKIVVALWWEVTIFGFPQVLQRVNERLLEKNPAEHQLFDVILITTDSWQQQQSSSIINSTRHHGSLTSVLLFLHLHCNTPMTLLPNALLLLCCRSGNQQVLLFNRGQLCRESHAKQCSALLYNRWKRSIAGNSSGSGSLLSVISRSHIKNTEYTTNK